jgi:ribosomal protein S12 methylthiotransferase
MPADASRPNPGPEIKVNLVSLGCPKNLVDSEMILGGLGSSGFVVTPDADSADVIVINTCGFVESAREESINTILEACQLKQESATPKKVVVTGCLGQRYGEDLRAEIPELDAIVGLGEYDDLGQALRGLVSDESVERYFRVTDPTKSCTAEVGRFRLTPSHFGYLKISEGCDNPCTFCAIPAIRGRFRSKSIEMLEMEARELVASGASELILISQDTTSYGVDLDGKFRLAELLERLAAIDGVHWIRLLYAYPAFMTDEMIDAIASIDKVVNYIDMPLQHISDKMLRHMGRRMMEPKTRALLDRMRERIPGLYLRTTFIVGFPGEDTRDFEVLRDFIESFRFERLGVFPYSPEDGTPSAKFNGEIPEDVINARLEELMLTQQQVAFAQNRERVGEVVEVLFDTAEKLQEPDDGGQGFVAARGRSFAESPEIDPVVYVSTGGFTVCGSESAPQDIEASSSFTEIGLSKSPSSLPIQAGRRRLVKITGTRDYDLMGVPVESDDA